MKAAVGLVLAFAAATVAPGFARGAQRGGGQEPNVLLVTLDTTRADRIGAYGWARGRTPVIDALAAGGVRFEHAYCQAPLTLTSHCSIMTGTYPLAHKVRNNGSYFLAPSAVTLAERLKEQGFRTSAFIASFNVDSRFGVDQGFDLYDDRMDDDQMLKTYRSERKADKVADAFLDWLGANAGSRFFSWVHFYDPHMPHEPPAAYREEFAKDLYDGEVAFMDHEFGRIVDALRDKGLLDRTIVVVAGDHGEALGEKEELDHGIFIYDATMRVPFVVRAPKLVPEGKVIDARVRLIDVMPTVLDLLGIPVNKEVQGTSLRPYMDGKAAEDLACYIESYYPQETYGWSPLVGLIDGPYKFIRAPRSELYDLRADPKEEKDLVAREAGTASRLNKKLDDVIKTYTTKAEAGRRTLSSEEEDRLRSLGYLAGGAVKIGKGQLPDPKDRIGDYKVLYQAKLTEYQGNYAESEKLHRELIRLQPDVSWHYIGLAILMARDKRVAEGIEVLKSGLQRLPESTVLMSRLASFYMRSGNFREALRMSQETLKRDPLHLDALVIGGWAEDMQGHWKESAAYFGKALAIEPENKYTRLKYAYALGALGRGEEAARIDEGLKKEFPDDARIASDLGVIYASLNKLDLAEANLRRAAELKPGPEAYLAVSAILERNNKLEEAVSFLRLFLETATEGETPRIARARKVLEEWERRLKSR